MRKFGEGILLAFLFSVIAGGWSYGAYRLGYERGSFDARSQFLRRGDR